MKPMLSSPGISDRMLQWGVTFLALLFVGFLYLMTRVWLVTAGSVQVQEELKKQLPGAPSSSKSANIVPFALDEFPDEVLLELSEKGHPSINDEPVANLQETLAGLVKKAGRRKLILTLVAHEKTPYGEITRTLDTLKAAGIANVTFTVGVEEGF